MSGQPVQPSNTKRSSRGALLAMLVIPAVAIFIRVAVASNVGLGLGAVVASGAFLYGLMAFSRRRATHQVAAIATTGRFEVDAGLDFDCLPDNWPAMARETLNAAGADRVPSLPVRLSIVDHMLRIDKRQSWGSGRQPFHAEVALAEVTNVTVDGAQRTYAGSSLAIQLKNGDEVRLDLPPLSGGQAEALAQRLRLEIPPVSLGQPPATGIVITSAPPRLRTSSGRAWLLLMAAAVPFLLGIVGIERGPVGPITAMFVLFYGLWMQLTRPPTMHRRLAVGLVVVAGAFLVDTVTTGEIVRLAGTIGCLGLAGSLARLSPPRY